MEHKYGPMVIKLNAHKVPEFKEVKGKEWIYYGDKNDYPQYLLKLYNRSAKHCAIINGKVSYIIGKGWELKDTIIKVEDKAKVWEALKGLGGRDSLTELTKKIALDYEIFKGFALEIIWNKGGKIGELNHVPFGNLRSNEDNSLFFYTSKWIKYISGEAYPNSKVREEKDFVEYDTFDPEKRKGKQLLYYKGYYPGLDTYPLPDYIGAIAAIETDVEIANFHLNNIKNGFSANNMLNFYNGVPTEEEQTRLEKKIKDKLTGTDGDKILLNFSDGKDRGSEVVTLQQSEAHNMYAQLRKDIDQEIFIGHRITSPMLFGVRVEGQLGGRTEMVEANELFQNTYITPRQHIYEKVINEIISINNVPGTLVLTKSEPIGMDWFNTKLFDILTVDERRQKAGLPVIKKQGFSKEVSLSEELDKCGTPKSKVRVLKSNFLSYTSDEDLIKGEVELLKQAFAIEIKTKSIDRSILDLLDKEPLTSIEELATALEVSESEVRKSLDSLVKRGLIKRGGDKETPTYTPSPKGTKVIDEKPAKTVDIQLMYSYDLRPDVEGGLIIPTTRDLCKEILAKDKMYTRAEIEMISNKVGYSVWLRTGGFYRNPDTGKITPYCRHQWVQNVVSIES